MPQLEVLTNLCPRPPNIHDVDNIKHSLGFETPFLFNVKMDSLHAFVIKFSLPFALGCTLLITLFRDVFLLLIINHQLTVVALSLISLVSEHTPPPSAPPSPS